MCLLEFADGDKLLALSLCVHVFHFDCIDVWLLVHAFRLLYRVAVALAAARAITVDALMWLHAPAAVTSRASVQ